MSDDDDFRDGEEAAIAWLEGRSELIADLAALVTGMPRELGAAERGFLVTVGNAAKQAARGHAQPMPADAPASVKAQPSPPPSQPSPAIDLDEYMRQRRERAQAARLQELWRENSAIPVVTRRDL
jgi:hypothetical protein